MLTTCRGCCAFESSCALPSGVIRGCETTSTQLDHLPVIISRRKSPSAGGQVDNPVNRSSWNVRLDESMIEAGKRSVPAWRWRAFSGPIGMERHAAGRGFALGAGLHGQRSCVRQGVSAVRLRTYSRCRRGVGGHRLRRPRAPCGPTRHCRGLQYATKRTWNARTLKSALLRSRQ